MMAVVRKNVIRVANQMDKRETIAKCRAFSETITRADPSIICRDLTLTTDSPTRAPNDA
jgi:hypothetical protein